MARRSDLLTWAIVLAGLAAGSAVSDRLPKAAEIKDAPFTHRVALGQPTTIRTGTVTVEKAEVAKTVMIDTWNRSTSEHGVYLVVTVLFQPSTKTDGIGDLSAEDREGRMFGGPQPTEPLCSVTQPGMKVRCQRVVEVDPNALEGLTIQITPERFLEGHGDDIAVVDLGIDSVKAKQWGAVTGEMTLMKPEHVR